MTNEQAQGFLRDIKSIKFLENEPMARHTTLKVGGPARFFILPCDENEVLTVLRAAETYAVPVLPLGRGSNVLVADQGYNGAVLCMGEDLSAITVKDDLIEATAGASLGALSISAAEANLSGLEFAGGIPGSIGGGVLMNAGAFGSDISSCVITVRCADRQGRVREYSRDEMKFAYRQSRAMQEGLIVLSTAFRLQKGNKEKIYAQMKEYAVARREKQPLNYPSAGSFFKRPEGHFAGALIEQAGLKGYAVGGAKVSEKHAGFLINTGDATADDFLKLKDEVQKRVLLHFGVRLEPEVRIISAQ